MPRLTRRQEQVVRLVAEGHTNKRIADALGISERGVKAIVSRAFDAYGVANRAALTAAIVTRRPVNGDTVRAADFAALRDSPFMITFLRAPDLTFVFANRAYIRRSGLAASRVIGMTLSEALPDAAGLGVTALRSAMRTGEPRSVARERVRWRDRHGAWRDGTFTMVVQPLRDASGTVAGLLTITAPAEESV